MKPLIKVKDLNFIYNEGKDNAFQALTNINFEIYPEEFIIFFGPSGCGKSTILNVVAGLETPEPGTVFVSDMDVAKMTRKEFVQYHRTSIGMIYQSYNLITSLSVLDNVALPQIFLSIDKKEREKKSLQLLDRFGIIKQAKKIPTELSGGQQQRIGIARSIVNDPDIVLADEPVGNLDSVSAKNVLDILKELNEKENKTIILVTHNPEFLEAGDRIFFMKDGMITRETVNRAKYKSEEKEKIKPPSTELENLMRAYQGLSPAQINVIIMPYKARIFAHHFITSRNMEEIKILENIIQKKLLGTISHEEFFDTLHRSYQNGGVGLDKRTAARVVRRINRKIRMAYYIYKKGHQHKAKSGESRKITLEEKMIHTTYYLLKTCYIEYYHELDEETVKRLKDAVKQRLLNEIDKAQFFNLLDKPFKKGGVGFNSKTARVITEELELILILGYGIVPKLQSKKEFTPREGTKEFTPAGALLAEQKEAIAQKISAPIIPTGSDDEEDTSNN